MRPAGRPGSDEAVVREHDRTGSPQASPRSPCPQVTSEVKRAGHSSAHQGSRSAASSA